MTDHASRAALHRSPTLADRSGFSAISAIVYLTLVGLLMAPLVATVVNAEHGFVRSHEVGKTTGSARFAQLALTRYMRMAGSHPQGPRYAGIDPDPDGDGVFNSIRIRADYNPPDGDTDDAGEDQTFFVQADTLYMRAGLGTAQPYLVGVDSLAFEYFDRDGNLLTDPGRVATRALEAQVIIRGRGEAFQDESDRVLMGRVRLRNRK